jgi:hypothetical protein|tara:strand:+ start:3312 stop:3509 length:198 start_codon:yes stop_codon:yes gene_type:complete
MDIWDEVVGVYNEEIQNLKNQLGSGSVEDHFHYRQVVGSIHGIEWARHNLKDILKKRTYAEEDGD